MIEDYWVQARIDREMANFQKKMAKIFTKLAQKSFVEATPIVLIFPLRLLQKNDFCYFLHYDLQCREHGVHQNVTLPKISPNRRILAKNSVFNLCNSISADGAFVGLSNSGSTIVCSCLLLIH